MKRAKPRRERSWPQAVRVLSTNFPEGFDQVGGSVMYQWKTLENWNVST